MSMLADAPEEEDFDKLFTVFDGSSPQDVSHARRLWSALSLLPPLEPRLVSADIRQRLQVSRPRRSGSTAASAAPPGRRPPAPEPPDVSVLRQEERRRYEAMADQRKEILALLGRQRQQRVQKELLSAAVKPKICRDKARKPAENSDYEMEKQMVKQLQ